MIIRKPYAFLIKHFKKIHIILLFLSAFIYYKHLQITSFVNEFMRLETYDMYNEPITNYVSFLPIFSMILLFLGSILLIILLRHKKKPWKLYIVPAFTYIFMVIVFLLFLLNTLDIGESLQRISRHIDNLDTLNRV